MNGTENLTKADFWTLRPLQRFLQRRHQGPWSFFAKQ
jgi:hypothetical protein